MRRSATARKLELCIWCTDIKGQLGAHRFYCDEITTTGLHNVPVHIHLHTKGEVRGIFLASQLQWLRVNPNWLSVTT